MVQILGMKSSLRDIIKIACESIPKKGRTQEDIVDEAVTKVEEHFKNNKHDLDEKTI